MHRIVEIVLFSNLLLIGGACSDRKDESLHDSVPNTNDAPLELVLSMDRHGIDNAFARLLDVDYSRRRVLDVFDDSGNIVSTSFSVVRFAGDDTQRLATLLEGDSIVVADTRIWNPPMLNNGLEEDTTSLSRLVLGGEPPFASPAERDSYSWSLGDTTVAGAHGRVVTVNISPGESKSRGVVSARLVVDQTSNELVLVRQSWQQRSLLFGESSTSEISIAQPVPGVWLPSEVALESRIKLPFARLRHFRVRTEYFDFESRE